MLFKKNFEELVERSLEDLQSYTDITNVSIGSVARTLLEIVNRQISEFYDVLEINHAMGFLSTAEGYFLDLIGDLFNIKRLEATIASAPVVDKVQRFYVTTGVLGDVVPSLVIPEDTTVSSPDGTISYRVTENVNFSYSAVEVYVPIEADSPGKDYNVGRNALISHSLDILDLYTNNAKEIVNGTDTESDNNYRYRISNTALASERANETAIRLAALSVPGVSDVVMKPFLKGIGTYSVLVLPTRGLADETLLANVQAAIDLVQAYGIRGEASAPRVVPVDLDIKIIFHPDVPNVEQERVRNDVRISIEGYIINIPVGGTFILNEFRQHIMNVSPRIRDHKINCYYFREQPHIRGNVYIYDDEIFYPNPNSEEAIRIV